MKYEVLPDEWNKAIIVIALHKKGDKLNSTVTWHVIYKVAETVWKKTRGPPELVLDGRYV